ncbi:MAG: hypothetical protein U0W40_01925 [Acidimicrobiia bacterium]
MLLPDAADAPTTLAAVQAAFAPAGGLDPLQRELLVDLARLLYGLDLDTIEPAVPEVPASLPEETRFHIVHLLVVLEFMEHPLREQVADTIMEFADHLAVPLGILRDSRNFAEQHFAAVYFDLQRSNWYGEETIRESLQGRFFELLRSKLAYIGVVEDRHIAEQWRSLRDCPPGSWGREVASFYERHGFPFPGEKHGIYELGARHDWVHVLADYETTPEGELDVFAFIAASMKDHRGVVLLAVTLGLFQNGSIKHVEVKRITNARVDTLSDPGAIARWADAFRRGAECPVDVMGTIDLFAHKDVPLDEARRMFGVVPK